MSLNYYELHQDGDVFILNMINHEEENTLSSPVLTELNEILDTLEQHQGNASLLLACDHPKTFSTGINLAWLKQQDDAAMMTFLGELDKVLLRLSTLNMPTIVAINGNCYAGGALIAACFDIIYMRADRGRFCFPEVNINLPLTPVMDKTVKLLPNPKAAYWLAITGEAWGGEKCAENQIIEQALPLDQLYDTALATAKMMAEKPRDTFTIIKREQRKEISEEAVAQGIIASRPVRKRFFS